RRLDAVEDLLGPNLLVWATELFAKPPHSPTVSIGWHRDRPYLGLKSGVTATAWIALSASRAANGCMRAMPRSLEAAASFDPPGDNPSVLNVELPAGAMSLHDPDILHGSGPNHSQEKRVGFVVRYLTP